LQTDVVTGAFGYSGAVIARGLIRGAHTLYNTYRMRFSHGDSTRAAAVSNSQTLLDAVARAGTRHYRG
jgi:hypothetical protein